MTYEFYKVMHLFGLFMVFSAVGAYFLAGMLGAGKGFANKRFVGMLHGFGLFIALVSGFGLLARLGIMGEWPGWVFGKLAIWLFLGGIIAVAVRKPQLGKGLWLVTLVVGGIAAYLARYKPF